MWKIIGDWLMFFLKFIFEDNFNNFNFNMSNVGVLLGKKTSQFKEESVNNWK